MRDINSITEAIIGDAISVHRELGPGLLESTYQACLAAMLIRRGLVVELKTVAKLDPVHFAQMMTYLKLSGCTVGLLINFNVVRLADGVRRVVRGYQESAPSAVL